MLLLLALLRIRLASAAILASSAAYQCDASKQEQDRPPLYAPEIPAPQIPQEEKDAYDEHEHAH